MIRWLGGFLVLLVASTASAQTADVIREGQPIAFLQPGRLAVPLPGGSSRSVVRPLRLAAPTPTGPIKFDSHGDPLPPGAVARLGTVRLRHGVEPAALGFSPDGKHLGSLSLNNDGMRLWDPATGKEAARLDVPITLAAFAKDGSVVLTDEARCKVWMPFPANAVRELPAKSISEATSAIAVHPDARTLAAGEQHKITLLDLTTGRAKTELKIPSDQPPQKLGFSPDGRWLAGNGVKTGIWLWDLKANKRVRTYPCQAEQCDFAFSTDGSRIAIAAEVLLVYPTDSEEVEEGYIPPENPLGGPRFSADGKSIFAHQVDSTVVRIEAATGQVKETWPPPMDGTLRAPIALAPEAAMAAAVDESGGIRIWNPKTGKGPVIERLPNLFDPGFALDGKTASCVDSNNRIHTFDPVTSTPGKVYDLKVGEGQSMTWDARTGRAAFAVEGDPPAIHVVEAATGKVLAKIPLSPDDPPSSIQFHPANRDRLTIYSPGSVALASISNAKIVRTLAVAQAFAGGDRPMPGPMAGMTSGAVSPDGRLVALLESPLSIWEVATGKKRLEVEGMTDPLGVLFSPDGRTLAAWDGMQLVLLDVRTGAARRRILLPGNDTIGLAARFAPDGKRLATGFSDGTITLWDVATGNPVLNLDRHDGAITGLSFSADGKTLLSTATDGTALVWDLTAKSELKGTAAVAGSDEAWKLIASPDPVQAQRGLEFLHRNPDEALKLVAAKIVMPVPTPPERIAKLILELGSEDFPMREAAAKYLEALGSEASPSLRVAVAKSTSPEVRKAASKVLAKLDGPPTTADDLRALRAVEVVEGIDTPAARDLLKKWSAGPPAVRLTIEAQDALERLNRREP